jgi:hypothetical protein
MCVWEGMGVCIGILTVPSWWIFITSTHAQMLDILFVFQILFKIFLIHYILILFFILPKLLILFTHPVLCCLSVSFKKFKNKQKREIKTNIKN